MGFEAWSVRNGKVSQGMPIEPMSRAMMALDKQNPGMTVDQLPSSVCLYRSPKDKDAVQVRVDGQEADVAFDKNGVAWLPAKSRVFFQFQDGSASTMAITANGRARQADGIDRDLSFLPVIPAGTPPLQANAMVWLDEGEVGRSSKQMCFTLAGVGEQEADTPHPRDPADLRRCLGFLAAVPQARERLAAMREVSPAWTGLIDRWDELEQAMGQPEPARAREIMKEILDPLEARRSFGPR